ncbi:MAG TPA: pyruvate, phosphate dikinase [Blastocatellia bacterium]|nr:pyruvate, phosphate dikinase [Blastocatellia bacterium]HMV81557.1 pyruvate, phosphate dikinase [Blastocatellia bacterium]HNG28512.1 pyruvate, phosphate dikinase [Blastocatellia bacterium]
MSTKYVYLFAAGQTEGTGKMKDLLGGKGSGLAEMTNAGMPVPPGFTITTEACNAYYTSGEQFPEGMWEQALEALAKVEAVTGKKFGGADNPLLVSVRSGAKFSMPGMMDTVLNLGLNDETRVALARMTNNERFSWDAYRRFIQLFGKIVLNIDSEKFEHVFDGYKKQLGVKGDTEVDAETLAKVVADYKAIVKKETGNDFPTDPLEQVKYAIKAVFASWNGRRAKDYRRINKIDDNLGTAVNVQTMVFGNMGEDSGTGVAFTRDVSTGEKVLYGEYLQNAQGEDVVAGIRTPKKIAQLHEEMPEMYNQFVELANRLEHHYKDVQDMEFTIERGTLYMLQTRNAKRTGAAAVRVAVEMVEEGVIDKATAIRRVEPAQLDQLLHPMIDPKASLNVIATGLPASPGAASGTAVFDPDEAEELAKDGKKVILVRTETSPEDFHGMVAAQAILTSRGGMTSHAAVVARGMGKCCVAGCDQVVVDYANQQFTVGDITVKKGDSITLDGSTGRVITGEVPLIEPEISGHFKTLMEWVNEYRKLGVRANADTPHDSEVARGFGAEGIGLCRTEHMFFEGNRIDSVRQMILSSSDFKNLEAQLATARAEAEKSGSKDTAKRVKDLEKKIAKPAQLYKGALADLLELQREDFVGIFRAMNGFPVTIRTLDPPLHEFVPHDDKTLKELAAKIKMPFKEAKAKVTSLHEFNPMLGHRGCRLGIIYPEITEMQARAIFEAAVKVKAEGVTVKPEIMIPLVGNVIELKLQADVVRRVAGEVFAATGDSVEYLVGTMIEVPRAALTANQIAEVAEFFSFGTNDLTQMTMGLSRDDSGKFLPAYVEKKIYGDDPFQVLDQTGVGQLVDIGIQKGRSTKADLKVGICGEHGGDPESVIFCHKVGMNYVSCSPYRVPIALLAAAHAALADQGAAKSTTA